MASIGSSRILALILVAWFSMLGFDFLLHGGILAGMYVEPSPFLLPPEQAFARIPVGYASFLALAILLVWLARRVGVSSWVEGVRLGLLLGVLMWGAFLLGLLSISTAPASLLVGWFIGQSVELAIAGSLVGAGLGGARLSRLWLTVFVLAVGAVVITVVLQNLGLAPALRTGST
jgi:hypothetical protein